MDTFFIFAGIFIVMYIVFSIEKEEVEEHNEEGIDNPYYTKEKPFFRTIKARRKNPKTLKGG